MKKLFGFLLILGIGYAIWYTSNKTASNPVPLTNKTNIESPSTSTRPDPSNATFKFEDGSITLTKGTNKEPVTKGSSAIQETTILEPIGYGDINKDGKEDAVVALMQSGAGTGSFIYIGAYVSGTINYKGTNVLYVGDRIVSKSIVIDKGEITFSYIDRKPDEPMDAEPTVSAYKTFVYTNGELKEKI